MKKLSFVLSTLVTITPLFTFAAATPGPGFGGSDLLQLATVTIGFLNKVITIVVALAVLMFLWSMVKYLLTADDAAARKEWRSYMIYGVVAITVIVGFWGLVNALLGLFGVGFIGPAFPALPVT